MSGHPQTTVSHPGGLRVALSAAAGSLRDRLAAALEESPAVACCRAEPDLGGGAFTTAVVLTPMRRRRLEPDLDAAERAFEALASAAVPHWVVISSSMVHPPSHRHPGMVGEEHTGSCRNRVADAWAALERLARERLPPAARLTVLRPAPVPSPDGEDFFSRLLRRRLAWTPAGFDPPLQLLDAADLARALVAAVERAPEGVFHVAPAAAVPLRRVLRRAGVRRLPMPRLLLRLARRADELDYLRYPWTVSGARLDRELGAGLRPRRAAAPDELDACDDFGMDRAYIAARGRTLLGFLHDAYWRIEWRGLEHVPRQGRAVLAGVHRGFQPWDGVMTLHLIASRLGRVPRFLVHPALVKLPFLAPFLTRLGGLLACRENADWVLQRDGLLGVYPEGIGGAFARYRDVYRLRRFGRHDFVRMALANRAPIVPFVTVGSAEIYPILAKVRWPWFQRHSEWPCLPITPTMGLVPLPSKWHVRFLEPLHVEDRYPAEAADDPAIVRSIGSEVRERMEAAIAGLLRRRKHVFWGSAFAPEPTAGALGEKPA